MPFWTRRTGALRRTAEVRRDNSAEPATTATTRTVAAWRAQPATARLDTTASPAGRTGLATSTPARWGATVLAAAAAAGCGSLA